MTSRRRWQRINPPFSIENFINLEVKTPPHTHTHHSHQNTTNFISEILYGHGQGATNNTRMTSRLYHRVLEQPTDDIITTHTNTFNNNNSSYHPHSRNSLLVNPQPDMATTSKHRQYYEDDTIQQSNPDPGPPSSSSSDEDRNRKMAISIFSLCTVLLFADQNLMSPNLTAMAHDFGLDNDERDRKLGGDISLAFFLLGAPASFLVGCLADQSDRSALFALTVGIGEGACVATYWVHTYHQLYICRAITGFSLGGALPLIYSILGDLYPAEERHLVSAAVSFGTGAGISVGQAVAGFLGPTFGWRLPFLVIGLPALVCALAVFLLVQDPERGAMEQVVLEQRSKNKTYTNNILSDDHDNNDDNGHRPTAFLPPSPSSSAFPATPSLARINLPGDEDEVWGEDSHYGSWFRQNWRQHIQTMIRLLSTPSVLLATLQGAPGCIPWGIVNAFLTDFLAQDRGFTVEAATSILMCFSVGHVFGMLVLGGGGGKYLYQLDNRYPALLAGLTAILGCVPFWILLNDIDSSTPYWRIAIIAMAMGVFTGPTGPIVKTTMTNVTLPRARGQAFALHTLFDDFGKGLGPFFVSLLISRLGGRLSAFNVGVLGWAVCGVLNLAIFGTVQKDEAAVQSMLASDLFGFPSSSSLKDTSSLIPRYTEEGENTHVDLELSLTNLQRSHP